MKLIVGFDDKPVGAYVLRGGKIDCVADSDAGRENLQYRLEAAARSMVMDHGVPEDQVTAEGLLKFIAENGAQGRNWTHLEE